MLRCSPIGRELAKRVLDGLCRLRCAAPATGATNSSLKRGEIHEDLGRAKPVDCSARTWGGCCSATRRLGDPLESDDIGRRTVETACTGPGPQSGVWLRYSNQASRTERRLRAPRARAQCSSARRGRLRRNPGRHENTGLDASVVLGGGLPGADCASSVSVHVSEQPGIASRALATALDAAADWPGRPPSSSPSLWKPGT